MKLEVNVDSFLNMESCPCLRIQTEDILQSPSEELEFTLKSFALAVGCRNSRVKEIVEQMRLIARKEKGTFCVFVNASGIPEIMFYAKGARESKWKRLKEKIKSAKTSETR